MSFDLEVTITGLCVFRPREAEAVMDVLMIEAPANHERHYPRVFYNAAYDSPMVPLGPDSRRISLEGSVLDLSGVDGQGGALPAMPDLVDLKPFTTALTDAAVLAGPPGVGCRVSLPPGLPTSPNPSGPWELQEAAKTTLLPKRAWHVVWTISGINGPELNWQLQGLGDPYGQLLVPLYPKNGKIKLLVSNVVENESKPMLLNAVQPAKDTPMPHFDAYQALYGTPNPWPKLIYKGPPALAGAGNPYSCLPSGGH
jgi:hypothetical protein